MNNKQFCPKCGAENTMDATFCSKCGNNLALAQQAATVAVTNPSYAAPNPYAATSPAPQYTPILQMNYPKAGIGSRFLAHLVDSLIAGLPMLPGALLISAKRTEGFGMLLLVIAGIWAVYYGFCKDGMVGGQSHGKRMNGLMVVSLTTNQTCTKGKSCLRALGLAIPYIGGIVEIIMVLVTDKGRRLGDKFADTQVIEVSQYRR